MFALYFGTCLLCHPARMNLLADFKSLISKGNAMSVAVGVAIGFAVVELASDFNRTVISPLLNMLTGGGEGITKLDTKFFRFGSLLEGIVHFAVMLAVIYAVFVLLLPLIFGRTSEDKSEAPLPPPPAPPV